MQTIGIIGGMSWESTVEYYKTLNRLVQAKCGKQHSAKILLTSVDFQDIEPCMQSGDWDSVAETLIACGQQLERGGADLVILGTNSPHHVAGRLEASLSVPFIHIVDPTGEEIRKRGMRRVGLIGTKFTMDKPFFRDRLADRFGVEALVPEAADRETLHRIIFEEMVKGRFLTESRLEFQRVIDSLRAQGAEGVILGCTEIAILLPPKDSEYPLFDTAELHARAAVEFALAPLVSR